ncbi:MAG: DUF2085 domain-containing protein [Erysipelotrichales bacterium]|nr:DUF2085 domain-containing protein [Erysipelotrichales bacterium]
MKNVWIKWLPIIFGCHCRPERSFHYKGQPFPICARCTGELVGILFGIVSYVILQFPLYINILLLVPMIIDGLIQLKTNYESTNIKRFLTGVLFGYGLVSIFIITSLEVYNFGYHIGK